MWLIWMNFRIKHFISYTSIYWTAFWVGQTGDLSYFLRIDWPCTDKKKKIWPIKVGWVQHFQHRNNVEASTNHKSLCLHSVTLRITTHWQQCHWWHFVFNVCHFFYWAFILAALWCSQWACQHAYVTSSLIYTDSYKIIVYHPTFEC